MSKYPVNRISRPVLDKYNAIAPYANLTSQVPDALSYRKAVES